PAHARSRPGPGAHLRSRVDGRRRPARQHGRSDRPRRVPRAVSGAAARRLARAPDGRPRAAPGGDRARPAPRLGLGGPTRRDPAPGRTPRGARDRRGARPSPPPAGGARRAGGPTGAGCRGVLRGGVSATPTLTSPLTYISTP